LKTQPSQFAVRLPCSHFHRADAIRPEFQKHSITPSTGETEIGLLGQFGPGFSAWVIEPDNRMRMVEITVNRICSPPIQLTRYLFLKRTTTIKSRTSAEP
jgi:hypothetical protein